MIPRSASWSTRSTTATLVFGCRPGQVRRARRRSSSSPHRGAMGPPGGPVWPGRPARAGPRRSRAAMSLCSGRSARRMRCRLARRWAGRLIAAHAERPAGPRRRCRRGRTRSAAGGFDCIPPNDHARRRERSDVVLSESERRIHEAAGSAERIRPAGRPAFAPAEWSCRQVGESKATRDVVVRHTRGLHEGVANRRADEAETSPRLRSRLSASANSVVAGRPTQGHVAAAGGTPPVKAHR